MVESERRNYRQGRTNLLGWDGQGKPEGLFPKDQSDEPDDEPDEPDEQSPEGPK